MNVLLDAEQIRERIIGLALEIERDYPPDEEIHLVGVLKGGFVFMADLIRAMSARVTVDFIAQFKVDIALIGISGLEDDGTLRDFDYREVKVARAIIDHSREVWLAADHSKFNRPAMVEVGQLAQVDMLFTEQAPPPPFPRLLADAGTQLVSCEAPP